MNKSFKPNEKGELIIDVNFGREDYLPFVEKAERVLATNVVIRGFRKGKAPFSEARKYLKASDIYNKMIDLMVKSANKTLLEGDEEHHSVTFNITPSVSVNYDKDKDVYTLTYVCVMAPIAKLGKITGLNIKAELKKIDDKAVESRLDAIIKEQGVLAEQENDYAAVSGDIVNIDAIGYIDGKGFDGGIVKAYDLELGSNSFVPGFEDQLIGVNPGTRKNVEIVFPENYVKEYQGKPATFDVTVNSIKKKIYPAKDDELAKSVTKYHVDTLAELKAAIKKDLEDEALRVQEGETLGLIYEAITNDATFIINENFLASEVNSRMARQLEQIKQYGISKEDYLSIAKVSEEEFDNSIKNEALSDVKRFAVIQAIITQAAIVVKDEDYIEYFGGEDRFNSFKKDFEEVKSHNEEEASRAIKQINNNILTNMVNKYLLANNSKSGSTKKPAAKAAEASKSSEVVEKKPAAKKTATAKTAAKKTATGEKKPATKKPTTKA